MSDNEAGLDDKGKLFFHITPKADACKHDFQGWREFSIVRTGP